MSVIAGGVSEGHFFLATATTWSVQVGLSVKPIDHTSCMEVRLTAPAATVLTAWCGTSKKVDVGPRLRDLLGYSTALEETRLYENRTLDQLILGIFVHHPAQ